MKGKERNLVTALVWILHGKEPCREASQIIVSPGLLGACLLYVKLYMLFRCVNVEFQRRPWRPELHT